jgi:hypothetical protein
LDKDGTLVDGETEWRLSPERMPDMLAEGLHVAASMILRGSRLGVG